MFLLFMAFVLGVAEGTALPASAYFPAASMGISQSVVTSLFDRFLRQGLQDKLKDALEISAYSWSSGFHVNPLRPCSSAGPFEAWGWEGSTTVPDVSHSVTIKTMGAEILDNNTFRVVSHSHVTATTFLFAHFVSAFCIVYDCDCSEGPSNWTLCDAALTETSFQLRMDLNVTVQAVPEVGNTTRIGSDSLLLTFTANSNVENLTVQFSCASTTPQNATDFPGQDPVFQQFNDSFIQNVSQGLRTLSNVSAMATYNAMLDFGASDITNGIRLWVTGDHTTSNGLHYQYRFDDVQTRYAHNDSLAVMNISIAAESCLGLTSKHPHCQTYNPTDFPGTLNPVTWALQPHLQLPNGTAAGLFMSSSILQVMVFHAFANQAFARNETLQVIDANLSETVYVSIPIVKFSLQPTDEDETRLMLQVVRGSFNFTCKNDTLKILVAEALNFTIVTNLTKNDTTQSANGANGLVVTELYFHILSFDFTGASFTLTYPRSGLPEETIETAIEDTMNESRHDDNVALRALQFDFPPVTGLLWNPSATENLQTPILHVIRTLNDTAAQLQLSTFKPNVLPPQPPPPLVPSVRVLTTVISRGVSDPAAPCGDFRLRAQVTQVSSDWTTNCRAIFNVNETTLYGAVSEWDSLFVQERYGLWPSGFLFPCYDAQCKKCGHDMNATKDDTILWDQCISFVNFDVILDVVPADYSLRWNTSGVGLCYPPSANIDPAVQTNPAYAVGTTAMCSSSTSSEEASVELISIPATPLPCAFISATETYVAISEVQQTMFGPCSGCPLTLQDVPSRCSAQSAPWDPTVRCVGLPQLAVTVSIGALPGTPRCPSLKAPWDETPSHTEVNFGVVVGVPVACVVLIAGAVAMYLAGVKRRQKPPPHRQQTEDFRESLLSLQGTAWIDGIYEVAKLGPHVRSLLGLAIVLGLIYFALWSTYPPLEVSATVRRMKLPTIVHPDPFSNFLDSWRIGVMVCGAVTMVALGIAFLCSTSHWFVKMCRLSQKNNTVIVQASVIFGIMISCASIVFPPMFLNTLHSVRVGRIAQEGTFFGEKSAHTDFREAASIAFVMSLLPELMQMISNMISAFPIGLSLGLSLLYVFKKEDSSDKEWERLPSHIAQPSQQEGVSDIRQDTHYTVPRSIDLVVLLSTFLIFCVDIVVISLVFQTTREAVWLAFSCIRWLVELSVIILRRWQGLHIPSRFQKSVVLVAPVVGLVATLVLNLQTTFASSPGTNICLHYFLVTLTMIGLVVSARRMEKQQQLNNVSNEPPHDAPGAGSLPIPEGTFRFIFSFTAFILWCLVLELRWIDAYNNTLRSEIISKLRDNGIKFPSDGAPIQLPIDPGLEAYVEALKMALWPLGLAIVLASFGCAEGLARIACFIHARCFKKNKESLQFRPRLLFRLTNTLAYICIVGTCAILCYRDFVKASHLNHLVPDCAPQFYADGEFLLTTAAGLFFDSVMLGRLVPLLAALVPASMRVLHVLLHQRNIPLDVYPSLALGFFGAPCLMLPLVFCVAIGESVLQVSLLAVAVVVIPNFVVFSLHCIDLFVRMRSLSLRLGSDKTRCGLYFFSLFVSGLSSPSVWWLATYAPSFFGLAWAMFVYDPKLRSIVAELLKDKSIQYEIAANLLFAGVVFLDMATLVMDTITPTTRDDCCNESPSSQDKSSV